MFVGEYEHGGSGNPQFWGGYRREPTRAAPSAGEIVTGQTAAGVRYHLRVPEDYDPARRYTAIAFFHGSNMSSASYVATIAAAWPELADDYIVVGFDGEQLSSASREPDPAFNFTYVNFSGHEVGEPWRYRQSPGLIADALQELPDFLPIDRWFVGGHSQGGFLTYAMVMFYPELVAGAFPMSCNLLVQCEPDNFNDEAQRALQRAVALAPIHGENDGIVSFSSGEYCYERMQDGGFPMLRFFTDPSAAHMFARLPVEEAVRWLEAITSDDAGELARFAEGASEQGQWRSAVAALARARDLGVYDALLESAEARVEEAGAEEAERLLALIRRDADNGWVDDFWAFREHFAFAPFAEGLMEAYAELRQEHAKRADELFYGSRGEDDAEKRDAMRRELLEECYASKWWKLVSRWME